MNASEAAATSRPTTATTPAMRTSGPARRAATNSKLTNRPDASVNRASVSAELRTSGSPARIVSTAVACSSTPGRSRANGVRTTSWPK
ncbi:hypothetical protein [Nannocystis pusilla]|uniref:hypothetical protein n=1 Tax=Nannocystis pusilla TaxID=889268 RepID=UPI003B771796